MLTAAFALAACGGGDGAPEGDTDNSAEEFAGQKRVAAQTVEDFSNAVATGDWSTICESLFTSTEVEQTAGILGGDCESELADEFEDNRDLNLTVEKVTTGGAFVTSGEVMVESKDDEGNSQTFTLADDGTDYRIDGYAGTFGAD